MKERPELLRELTGLARETGELLTVLRSRGVTRLPALPEAEKEAPPAANEEATLGAMPEDMGKEARMEHLQRQAQGCTRCRLSEGRTKVVFGEGSANARVMFVGEGPGAHEDRKGVPFVGRAGQLLTRMLGSIGIKRESVYITNVVKCRPPQNRDPLPDEIAACRTFLNAQIATISPDIMVTLGRPASQSLLADQRSLGELRKSVHKFDDRDVVVTYHPAYLLRSPARKMAAWEDLMRLTRLMVKKKMRPALPPAWWRR
jgi:uracil-DNA glycosylase